MSSSDSDYSIDWLASDEEDTESERGGLGADCMRWASASSTGCGGKSCPSPPTSGESQASSCSHQHLCDGGSEDGSTLREEEKQQQEEEEEDQRSLLGMSDGSTCSSPSSCTSSCDRAEARRERLGTGTDKPWHPWSAEAPKKRLAHKRPRSSGGPEQREEWPLAPLQTDKDRLFASKCTELQSYILPLSAILNGLRSGRYRERLSSFQESVAMDRIQRIMGVLQNPHMGERYINIILKVEEMLKSWFPHVKPAALHSDKPPGGDTQFPSKKQKLSPAALARPVVMATPASACVHASAAAGAKGVLRARDLTPPGPYSATTLKWLHTSPICSPAADPAQGASSLRTAPLGQDLTQDNAVSSSTDAATPIAGNNTKAGGARGGKTDSGPTLTLWQPPPPPPSLGRPPLAKINAPCLERLLKSTESIITQRGAGAVAGSGWS